MDSRRLIAVCALTGLCALPACGDDDSSDDGGGSSGSGETASVTFETTEPSRDEVAIRAPRSIEAGVTDITLRNSGRSPHDAQLVRVTGDQTADEVIENVIDTEEGAGTPPWARGAGGLGTVAPGQTATVTEALEPGTYYVVDTESSGDNAPPNARKGGIVRFEVTGEGGGELPSTDATITADEYSFEASGVKPGENRLTFENAGEELHHVLALPIRRGATIADARRAFTSEQEPQGPPPVDFESLVGTAVIDGGEEQVVELDFEPGRYALVCFIADRAGGPSHAAKGMISELDVQ